MALVGIKSVAQKTEMTLRNKKWNHLFSVTSYNKQRLSTAAVRIPCICWLMAIQAWVDFRHYPLWVTAKLAYSFCGRIPVPRFISPVSQSSVHTALHRKSQIKFISSLQNWVLRVGFCNHHPFPITCWAWGPPGGGPLAFKGLSVPEDGQIRLRSLCC